MKSINRIKKYIREPVNGLTHIIGALFSLGGLVLLLYEALDHGSVSHIISFAVFGISMILVYTASSLYHSLPVDKDTISLLQRLDHSMIYVMIAGTYTPICLIVLDSVMGYTVLITVWSVALVGIAKKFVFRSIPHSVSVILYLLMGWSGILLFPSIMDKLPLEFLAWISLGGVAYSAGAIIFGIRKPDPIPGWFGFHEIWHLFVMAGTTAHFWAIYNYLTVFGI